MPDQPLLITAVCRAADGAWLCEVPAVPQVLLVAPRRDMLPGIAREAVADALRVQPDDVELVLVEQL